MDTKVDITHNQSEQGRKETHSLSFQGSNNSRRLFFWNVMPYHWVTGA
jgi:hypothetical protein